jgi:hypothetical protein
VAIGGGCRTEDDTQDLTRRTQFGGAEGDRTPDLRIANATLSQLSYGPVSAFSALRFKRGGLCGSGRGLSSGALPARASRASAIRVLRDLRTPAADATVPAPLAAAGAPV